MVSSVTEPSIRTGELGSLFVRVTGQSTVTDRQRDDYPIRFTEHEEGRDITAYLYGMTVADGLDEAIPEPETSNQSP